MIKTIGMLKVIIGYYTIAQQAVVFLNSEINWAKIREAMGEVMDQLSSMKFQVRLNWDWPLTGRIRRNWRRSWQGNAEYDQYVSSARWNSSDSNL